MNRRHFFKALLAIPVATIAAPLAAALAPRPFASGGIVPAPIFRVPPEQLGPVVHHFNCAHPDPEYKIYRAIQRAFEQNRQQSVAAAIDYQRR
jgi:hypothetical protein